MCGGAVKAAARRIYSSPPLPRPRPPGPSQGALGSGARAHAALAVSRARPRPPLPPPFPPLPPSALSLGGGGGGSSRSLLARYIKGRSRRTGRLELQPVAAAAALGAVTGVGFPPRRRVGSGRRPLTPRGVVACIFFFQFFFFFKAILEALSRGRSAPLLLFSRLSLLRDRFC